jgi:four helix bundle protein
MSRLSKIFEKEPSNSRLRLFVFTFSCHADVVRGEVIGHQLLRSGTSVTAHVREVSRSRSDAELCSKLEGAIQEADESMLWLELLRDDCSGNNPSLAYLHAEANEIIAICVTIVSRIRRKSL